MDLVDSDMNVEVIGILMRGTDPLMIPKPDGLAYLIFDIEQFLLPDNLIFFK